MSRPVEDDFDGVPVTLQSTRILEQNAPQDAIGQVRSVVGAAWVSRANTAFVDLHTHDWLFQTEVLKTGPSGSVTIEFVDGTIFKLGRGSCLSLDEFACDSKGTLRSSCLNLLAGTFAFIGRSNNLSIHTPVAAVRGSRSGLGILTLAAFTFALLKEAHADIPGLAYLIDDQLTFKDLDYSPYEIITKGANPQAYVIDDPTISFVVSSTGSSVSVQTVTNSTQQMAILLGQSQDAYGTFMAAQSLSLGQRAQGPTSGGSGGSSGFTPSTLQTTESIPIFVTQNNTLINSGNNNSSGTGPQLLELQPPPFTFNPPTASSVEALNKTGSSDPDIVSGSISIDGNTNNLTVSNALFSTLWSAGGAPPSGLAQILASALATSINNGAIEYVFSAADSNFDFLAGTETLAITYNLTVSNGPASSTEQLTFTVNGSNDAPVLAAFAGLPPGALEITGVTGSATPDTAAGSFSFIDVDLTNTHTASSSLASAIWSTGGALPSGLTTVLGSALTTTVATDSTGTGLGSVASTFSAADSNFDFLAAGQTLTIVYNVTISDGTTTSAQPITFTVGGTNDAPSITGHDDGSVVSVDGSPGNLTDSGAVSFSDADLTDIHSAGATFVSSTFGSQLGSLTAGPAVNTDTTGSGVGGQVTWNFTVANSAAHALAFGQTVTETYAVTVNDGHGGTATQNVEVIITNDEALTISLSGGAAVVEGDATAFTVHLSNALAPGVTASINIAINLPGGITGAEAADFTNTFLADVATAAAATAGVSLVGSTLTFDSVFNAAAGFNFTLPTFDDAVDESNETYTVVIDSPNSTIGTPALGTSIATGTILDNDQSVISVAGASITEGGNLVFTVSRTLASEDSQTVSYAVTNGTAESTDYNGSVDALTGTVTFAPGELSKTITIATVNDSLDEGTETVTVTLTNPQGASPEATPALGTSIATGTILDNDQSVISVAGASITEGGNLVFTVSRTLASEDSQTVSYAVTNGTAESTDYNGSVDALTGTVTFAPGELSKTITIATVNDSLDEGTETVTVTLTNPQGASPEATPALGTSIATGTILDNDQSVISVAGASITEGGNLVFTVSRTLASEDSQTVSYAVTNGTAESTDYNGSVDALTGTVTFAPGELSKTITIATVNDSLDEGTETVTVTLTNPQGASPEATPALGTSIATGTILDNGQSVISVAGASITEGGNLVFTVSRTLASEDSQTVSYAVTNGTAESTDYNGSVDALTGTVTFAPGELSKTITIATVNDSLDEGTETVTVTLTNPQGASPEATPALGTSIATGTILDNDQSVISVAGASITEGGNLVFTVSRTLASEDSQTVSYAVTNGTAESTDYNGSVDALTGTVTFAPGELSKTITIATVNDSLDEGTETVTVTLTNPQGASPEATPALGTSIATGTILDNDQSVISVAGASITEGGNLVFTVSRTLASEDSQTVSYAVTNGTAESTDYNGSVDALTGTVTFAPGELSKTITIATVNDSLDEGTETVTVTLTNPQGASPEATPALGTSIATGTILDNGQSVISVAGASITEGGNLVFTVSRTLASEDSQTVSYAVTNGTAESTDYNGSVDALTGTVTFAPGELSKTITIATVNDSLDEGTETVTVTLTNPQGASPEATPALGTSIATGTILDNDQSVISVAGASITEGGNLVFTVSRTLASEDSQTVSYAVTNGTAESTDYNGSVDALTGTVTFAPGELSKTITIATVNDSLDEGTETVTVTLTNPQGASPEATPALGTSIATGTILDNGQSVISVAGASITEGGNLVFTVSRTLASEDSQTVSYAVTNGTAESTDYNGSVDALTGTVTFAPGELSKTITIATVNDSLDEGTETVTVTLTNPQGASPEATPALGTSIATGTILDNDQSVISVAGASITEGGNLVFTVSRTLASEDSQTVSYAVTNGTAESTDYNGSVDALTGTVTFAPGELSKTITIATVNDSLDEGTETVTVTLTNPQGASPEATPALGTSIATGTILDNDQSVISVAGASITEGGNLVFTVSRTLASEDSQTVSYAVTNGTAESTDYNGSVDALTGTVTFAPGELSKTITIATVNDSLDEGTETVTVTLTNPQGASPEATPALGTSIATGTILDNDQSVISVAGASITEGGNLVFTVSRTLASEDSQTVSYAVTNGTAESTDYNGSVDALTGTVTFAPGELSKTITIATVNDAIYEGNETVTVTLSNPQGASAESKPALGTATATGTILEDDAVPTASIAVSPTSVLEDGATNLVYTVTLDHASEFNTTINYTVGGTATEGTDYTGTAVHSITILAGATSGTITVDPTADLTFENDETVTLTLTGGTTNGQAISLGTPSATGTITNDDASPPDPNDHDDFVIPYSNPNGTFVPGGDPLIPGGDAVFGTPGPGPDNINGGNHPQAIYGGAGDDVLTGFNQIDKIFGGSGNDTIHGATQNDILYGGSGNDTITGDNGNDTIIGGYGSDKLWGGIEQPQPAPDTGGADTFQYLSPLDASDQIMDFNPNGDVLEFRVASSGAFSIGNNDTSIIFHAGADSAINVAGTEIGVKTDQGVATGNIQSTIDSYTNITTGALFTFLDTSLGHAVVYYDPNPSLAGGATLIAELVDITTLTGIALGDFHFIT